MTNPFFGTPLKQLCALWINGKAADRKAIAAHVRAGAERKDDSRWRNAAVDMEAGDTLRVKARSTGDRDDWAKAKAANPKTAAAKPKASAKKAKAEAEAKSEPKAPATSGKQTVASLSKRMDTFEKRMDTVETRLDRIGDSLEVMMGLMQGGKAAAE